MLESQGGQEFTVDGSAGVRALVGQCRQMVVETVADDGVWVAGPGIVARVRRQEWSANGDMLDWWEIEQGHLPRSRSSPIGATVPAP